MSAWIAFSFAVQLGCGREKQTQVLPEANRVMELEARLTSSEFSLLQSDREAVKESMQVLATSVVIPDLWQIDFASTEVKVPKLNPENAVGIKHTSGRISAVYLFDDVKMPGYGEFVPLALAHYLVPEPRLDVILLLVCFQSSPDGALTGIGVRSLDMEGVETSAPFALALDVSELQGKFFYDEFISGSAQQAVAGRASWDRGFLLLTRLSDFAVLSTYLPWY